jgi:hypothetical protein
MNEEEPVEKPKFIKVAALWVHHGKPAYTGRIEEDIPAGSKILLFKNEEATEENRQPTYRIVIPIED